jgi:hypothetical protein
MKAISYIATLPAKFLNNQHSTSEKFLTLQKYAEGVSAAGDVGILSTKMQYEPADVAVMLGWVHEHGKQAPHLQFRQHIIEEQARRGGRTVIADSNLFLYADTNNPLHYLRYSFDGIFPNTGEYRRARGPWCQRCLQRKRLARWWRPPETPALCCFWTPRIWVWK